jgi:hypothetical protein
MNRSFQFPAENKNVRHGYETFASSGGGVTTNCALVQAVEGGGRQERRE